MSRRANSSEESIQRERKLVEDVQLRKAEAFDALMIQYKDMVFNLCYRLLGDYDEANDCAQETFIKVYRNVKSFKFKSSLSTWIYRIAVNTCKNHLSSATRRFQIKAVRLGNPAREGEPPLEIRDVSQNPASLFERGEEQQAIQRAIESLPPRKRILVVLRDVEGKSYEEIARITGLKAGTVKSTLARAREQLRQQLKGII